LASKGREVGLYDFTIYEVIRRNSRCFEERPAWLGVSDWENVYPAEVGKAKDVYGQKQGSIELNTMAIVSTRLFFKS